MLLSVERLNRFFGIRPSGVLHVGAHEAQESVAYTKYNWGPVIWVEMLPDKYEAIRSRFSDDTRNVVLKAACWDVDGAVLSIFRASNSGSSSLMAPEHHLVAHPEIKFVEEVSVATSRLDSILPVEPMFDFLNMDIQGAELKALRGLGERLSAVKWACIEVHFTPLYAGSALINEVDGFMAAAGFSQIVNRAYRDYGWGEALYANTHSLSEVELVKLRRRAKLWNAYYYISDNLKGLRQKNSSNRARRNA